MFNVFVRVMHLYVLSYFYTWKKFLFPLLVNQVVMLVGEWRDSKRKERKVRD